MSKYSRCGTEQVASGRRTSFLLVWQHLGSHCRNFRGSGSLRIWFNTHCNVWESLLDKELLFQPLRH